MRFTEEQILSLTDCVGNRLSKYRFRHTLGVKKMAEIIGKLCIPEMVDELCVAALLHDISKEYSEAEHLSLLEKYDFHLLDEDKKSPALWHSFTAPYVIMEDFPEYATENVLSAVANHTVGSPSMSLFDEIILISDYTEEGRTYDMCANVRDILLSGLSKSSDREGYILSVHNATLASLNNTINEFVSRGKSYHERTKMTRDSIVEKIERIKNG